MTPILLPVNSGRIAILGDLHHDRYRKARLDPFTMAGLAGLDWAALDALIIAGDLADAPQLNWRPALDWLGRYLAPGKIFLLPGNHDYYGHALGADRDLAALAASRGARLVQKQALQYGDIRLLCCTLWTDFALMGDPEAAMLQAANTMLDYDRISRIKPGRSGNHVPITPEDALALHRDHRAWLEAALAAPHFAGLKGRTAVITHHAPTRWPQARSTRLPPRFIPISAR